MFWDEFNVFLPKPYINYFVLTEWNLKQEQLYIYI